MQTINQSSHSMSYFLGASGNWQLLQWISLMLFPLPDLKSERKVTENPRITHELVCKTHCQALLFLRCYNSGILALQDFPPIPQIPSLRAKGSPITNLISRRRRRSSLSCAIKRDFFFLLGIMKVKTKKSVYIAPGIRTIGSPGASRGSYVSQGLRPECGCR